MVRREGNSECGVVSGEGRRHLGEGEGRVDKGEWRVDSGKSTEY